MMGFLNYVPKIEFCKNWRWIAGRNNGFLKNEVPTTDVGDYSADGAGGAAKPAPPVGPALGQYRLNLMAFCKNFTARTQKYRADTPMAVTITAFTDNTFEFIVKSPSVTWYLKKAAGRERAAGARESVDDHVDARVRDREDQAGRSVRKVPVTRGHFKVDYRHRPIHGDQGAEGARLILKSLIFLIW